MVFGSDLDKPIGSLWLGAPPRVPPSGWETQAAKEGGVCSSDGEAG